MKCLFLINPLAGGGAGKAISAMIEKHFHAPGISSQIVFTNPGKLQQQVHSLAAGVDLLIICGGDGTISNVANALGTLHFPPPFSIIPAGTGNDIARSLGWYSVWKNGKVLSFMYAVKNGRVKGMDLWTMGGRKTFLAYAGFGLDAEIVKIFTRWRARGCFFKFCGPVANRFVYVVLGMRRLLFSWFRGADLAISVKAPVNGKMRDITPGSCAGIILGNVMRYASGGRLASGSRFDDGLLEIYFLESIMDFQRFLLKGRIPGLRGPVADFRASCLEVMISGNGVPWHVDGEWMEISPTKSLLKIERTRSLPVLIPPDHPHIEARDELDDDGHVEMDTKGAALPGPAAFK